MKRQALVLSVCIGVSFAALAEPIELSHSGFLRGANDAPLDRAETPVTFRLFEAAKATAGETALFEAECAVDVVRGYYAVMLGSDACGRGLSSAHFPARAKRFLELAVDGKTLSPRLAVGRAPVAANALDAASLGGVEATKYALKTDFIERDARLDTLEAGLDDERTERVAKLSALETSVDTRLREQSDRLTGLATQVDDDRGAFESFEGETQDALIAQAGRQTAFEQTVATEFATRDSRIQALENALIALQGRVTTEEGKLSTLSHSFGDYKRSTDAELESLWVENAALSRKAQIYDTFFVAGDRKKTFINLEGVDPDGWYIEDGREVAIATDPDLFTAIGVTFGALTDGNGNSGTTHFRLPDTRGLFDRMVDNPQTARGAAGADPNASLRIAQASGGSSGNKVGSMQSDAFQSHRHGFTLNGGWGKGPAASGKFRADSNSPENPWSGSVLSPSTDSGYGSPRVSSETRPKNVYTIGLIKR